MKHFLLIYDVVDDYVTRRAPHRGEHLTLARDAADRGELRYGGAFADPADGAVLAFRGADRGVAERFAPGSRSSSRRRSKHRWPACLTVSGGRRRLPAHDDP